MINGAAHGSALRPATLATLPSLPGDATVTPKGAAMKFTRGFRGRGQEARDSRLPSGQYDVGSAWPVLTAEATPRRATESWTFAVSGLGGLNEEEPGFWERNGSRDRGDPWLEQRYHGD